MAGEQAKLLKKADVCVLLNVSPRCLENMVTAHRFPPGVQVGKYIYWSERTIDGWLKREFGHQENWRP